MIALVLFYLSGMCEGVMDTLSFHFARFQKKHKKASDKFWNPEFSWLNKYDSVFKPKYFGATTFLVFTTDGWHLFKWLRNIFLFSALIFIDCWWLAPLCYLSNRLGFTIVYNWFYR
jgi:hypothetical protein